MSDPGITYRTREEVAKTRAERDPIEMVKAKLVDAKMASEEDLKAVEREVRQKVQDALNEAIAGKAPEVRGCCARTVLVANRSAFARNARSHRRGS